MIFFRFLRSLCLQPNHFNLMPSFPLQIASTRLNSKQYYVCVNSHRSCRRANDVLVNSWPTCHWHGSFDRCGKKPQTLKSLLLTFIVSLASPCTLASSQHRIMWMRPKTERADEPTCNESEFEYYMLCCFVCAQTIVCYADLHSLAPLWSCVRSFHLQRKQNKHIRTRWIFSLRYYECDFNYCPLCRHIDT